MPEQESKGAELEQQLTEMLEKSKSVLASLYDQAIEKGEDPKLYFLKDRPVERSKEIFGEERIDDLLKEIRGINFQNKDQFVQGVIMLVEPLAREQVFNPEIQAKIKEVEEKYQPESLITGELKITIHPSEWEFTLSDGTEISKGELVFEINWPEKAEIKGTKDIKESFQKIAEVLRSRQEIKAVIGVSWMMSRGITGKLGFEKFPELKLEDERKLAIIDIAQSARRDKPYKKGVNQEDVMVGAMSREQFLEKFEK